MMLEFHNLRDPVEKPGIDIGKTEDLVNRHEAKDATARKTALAEFRAAATHPSQYAPDMQPIPEKSWAYRIAKKIAFHDYGVYEKHFDQENWEDPRTNMRATTEPLVQISK